MLSLPLALLLWLSPSVAPKPPHADRIVVSKSHHTLTLMAAGKAIRSYSVALGRATGPKQFEGDHKTPEGHYFVDGHKPNSRFHRALHLSYPDPADRSRAVAAHRSPGSDIEIHGVLPAVALIGRMQHLVDWTDGCIALTNAEIDEVYNSVPDGTPVDIEP